MKSFLLISVLSLLISIGSYAQNSLLWEISGQGVTEKSYLYGTIHLNDQRFLNVKPSVIEALERSDMFVMELILDSIDLLSTLGSVIMSHSIKNLLSDHAYKQLSEYFDREIGVPLYFFDKVYPLYIASMMTDNYSSNSDTVPILDIFLFKLAIEKGKKVRALEKSTEQLEAIISIPIKSQIKILEAEVMKLSDTTSDLNSHLFDLYLNEDLDGLYETSNKDMTDRHVQRELITKRNQTMVKRITKLLSKYSVFVAVGALHLPGKKGLIHQLQKRGYNVQPVLNLK